MDIKPLSNRVLVQPILDEHKTEGGIIVPDTVEEKPIKGKIVAVGPGKLDNAGKRLPLEIKVNDTVLYSKYAGTEFKVDNKEYLIMNEDDILAVLN